MSRTCPWPLDNRSQRAHLNSPLSVYQNFNMTRGLVSSGLISVFGLIFIVFKSLLRNDCWFSHDVTEILNTKLSILLRTYFHDVLEQLKTNVHTNLHFKSVLGFVLEYA